MKRRIIKTKIFVVLFLSLKDTCYITKKSAISSYTITVRCNANIRRKILQHVSPDMTNDSFVEVREPRFSPVVSDTAIVSTKITLP